MKKLVIGFLSLIFIFLILDAVLFFYALPKYKIQQITSCTHGGARLLSVTNGSLRIPYWMRHLNFYLPLSPTLCDIHLKKYRGTAEEVAYLNAMAGAYSIARENSGGNGLRNRAKNIENLKFLISKGLDVNAKTDYEKVSKSFTGSKTHVTALYLAVASKDLEAVQILIDNGADPNIKDDRGMTALEMAIKLEESRSGAGYDGTTDISGIVGILKEAQPKK
jgi:Ankyrin repeats (many copies)